MFFGVFLCLVQGCCLLFFMVVRKCYICVVCFLFWGRVALKRLSRNQRLILKYLGLKSEMTTRELAEIVLGRVVEYRSKEYSSISRSLRSLEREGLVGRVEVQLRWRLRRRG